MSRIRLAATRPKTSVAINTGRFNGAGTTGHRAAGILGVSMNTKSTIRKNALVVNAIAAGAA